MPESQKDVFHKNAPSYGKDTTLYSEVHKLNIDTHDFARAGRSTYLRVNLDAIWNNVQILRKHCAESTKIIAVIKANAYGHGSVGVAKYLNNRGIFYFAVATAYEGKELRVNGISGYIQVLGNCVEEEIDTLLEYSLTPTATSVNFINKWATKIAESQMFKKKSQLKSDLAPEPSDGLKPSVVVKVDTGMSRNGCQCDELPALMQACEKNDIPVHSIMTHFAQSWDDPEFTQRQLDAFLDVTRPYRDKGVKVHAANSAAIIKGYAGNLDFVRPGVAMYGLAPDSSPETASVMNSLGMQPALSWIAKMSLVKHLEAGRKVGYDQTYRLTKPESIGTFGFGYADGYNRLLSKIGILTDVEGNTYEIVGKVSMDAVTVRVNDSVNLNTKFYVISGDYTSPNSASKLAETLNTIPYEIGTSLSSRMPRVFLTEPKYQTH